MHQDRYLPAVSYPISGISRRLHFLHVNVPFPCYRTQFRTSRRSWLFSTRRTRTPTSRRSRLFFIATDANFRQAGEACYIHIHILHSCTFDFFSFACLHTISHAAHGSYIALASLSQWGGCVGGTLGPPHPIRTLPHFACFACSSPSYT